MNTPVLWSKLQPIWIAQAKKTRGPIDSISHRYNLINNRKGDLYDILGDHCDLAVVHKKYTTHDWQVCMYCHVYYVLERNYHGCI